MVLHTVSSDHPGGIPWDDLVCETSSLVAEAVRYENFWFHDGPWTEDDFLTLAHGRPNRADSAG